MRHGHDINCAHAQVLEVRHVSAYIAHDGCLGGEDTMRIERGRVRQYNRIRFCRRAACEFVFDRELETAAA